MSTNLLVPGQCGESQCIPCELGTCCSQGPVTSITISGGTGCWAALNGTWALTASGCVSDFVEYYSSPSDPCVSGFCFTYNTGTRNLWFHVTGVLASVTLSSLNQSLLGIAQVLFTVYDDVSSPPCGFAASVPLEQQQLNLSFSRSTCRSGSLALSSDELAGFGDPPDSVTLSFD
jgi:hypothetical protein